MNDTVDYLSEVQSDRLMQLPVSPVGATLCFAEVDVKHDQTVRALFSDLCCCCVCWLS